MKRMHKSVFLSCTVLISLLIFSMGASAEQTKQPQAAESQIITMGTSTGLFYFCGYEIALPDSGDVIYGTIDNLTGTETTLADVAFTALTPGSDYTWWIYYDDTNAVYCLSFDSFVMTTPLDFVFGCEVSEAFNISITDSTLLGNQDDFALIYTYGEQNLSINNSTLIQSSNYGHIACCDSDLTATVNDSTLTSSGGNGFIVNYMSEANACALMVTFSGENTVSCYYDLLYYFSLNYGSSATLIVNDDFSYTTYDDDAVVSAGDVTINVAEGATLDLNTFNWYYTPVCSYGGDVTILGDGIVQLHSENGNAVYSNGTIDISGCTLNAITDSSYYGALEAEDGINYNDLFLLTPINGSLIQIIRTWYYVDAVDDYYVELSFVGESEAYYYDNNGSEMIEDAFETATASSSVEEENTIYTISTDILPAQTVRLAPDQSGNYVNCNSWPDWAKTGIVYVINAGFMGSTSSSTLKFDENIAASRAMMAQFLYNHAGNPEVTAADITTYNDAFSDVDGSAWYYNAVVWATNEGYVKGVGDGKFAPNADVTREQAMTMLWRYNGSVDSNYSLNSFGDNDQVSSYAQTAFAWAVENDIINGMPSADGTILSPKTNCTRAQMAVILYNYENSLNQ